MSIWMQMECCFFEWCVAQPLHAQHVPLELQFEPNSQSSAVSPGQDFFLTFKVG